MILLWEEGKLAKVLTVKARECEVGAKITKE